MRGELMSKFFLIFSLVVLGINPIIAQDSASVVMVDEPQINYPGKPLIMSLVLPGAGQYYNKSPMWKTTAFLGVEVGSILAMIQFNKKAELLKDEYEAFANKNWSLNAWVNNRFNPTTRIYNDMSWTNFSALLKLIGTHELEIILTGSLKELYGKSSVSSDSLEIHPEWINSGEISVVTDRHFYENIGKYDQFVGGWSDANTDWYWEEKQLEDSTEIVIKTPMKKNYIDQRFDSNQMLNMAKYSITVLLFNHVISGLEAVLTNQKQARDKQKSQTIETDVSLLYNPYNPGGIGGIAFTINF